MSNPFPQSPRKRRALYNGPKIGSYSFYFLTPDSDTPQTRCLSDPAKEIASLRLFIRRLAARAAENASPAQDAALLRTLCLAMITLVRLLHPQQALTCEGDWILKLALLDASNDLGMDSQEGLYRNTMN